MSGIWRVWLAFIGGLLFLPAFAQQGPAPLECKENGNTLLWQVEVPDGVETRATINLFGSIHVGKPEFYPLPAVVERQYQQAQTVVFEINPLAAQSPESSQTIQQRGRLRSDRTLEQIIDQRTLRSLEKVLKQFGLNLGHVNRMKPWLVSMLLSSMQVQALGYDPANGVENYLIRQKPQAAQIDELESLETQLALMESFDQVSLLRYTLRDFANTKDQMNDLAKSWRCGDSQKLAEILFEARTDEDATESREKTAYEKLMLRLFDERNLRMADKIEGFIKHGAGSYFVVAGTGHLLGKGSVVELLQKRGYRVTRVKSR